MTRLLLFLLLVVGVPGALYYVAHRDAPEGPLRSFGEGVAALGGSPSPRPETAEKLPPHPAKKDHPKSTEVSAPEPKAAPSATRTPPAKEAPEEDPAAKAARLLSEGKFEEAQAILAYQSGGADLNLARLGAALARAFPADLPKGPYVEVTTSTGTHFEGFSQETPDGLKLISTTGSAMTLPDAIIASKTELPRRTALDRAKTEVQTEGGKAAPARLFALIQEAFTIGQPASAIPLLKRALAIDDPTWFLASVKDRVPKAHQDDVFRAYAASQVEHTVAADQKSGQAPKRLGGGETEEPKAPPPGSPEGVRIDALVKKGEPYESEGMRLYRKTLEAGLKGAKLEDIDKAIDDFEKAMDIYGEAQKIQDTDAVYHRITRCSKLAGQLRFWKDQVSGR